MKTTYGFRATVKARPEKGDELVSLLLAGRAEHQDEVPVGGGLNAGATR